MNYFGNKLNEILNSTKATQKEKKRCKHLTGSFIELMSANHKRMVWNGDMDKIGFNDIDNITGYEFHCSDCKKNFKFKSSFDAPKWAQKYFDAL